MNTIKKGDPPEVINFTNEVRVIRAKYAPRHWSNPDAMKELADLWGASGNNAGVLPRETETIVDTGSCKGQIHFAHTSKDYWLIGLSAMSAFNGRGYSPSISGSIGYTSRHRARKEGVKGLISFFEAVVHDSSSCNSESNKAHAKKAVSALQKELTPQLNLFG